MTFSHEWEKQFSSNQHLSTWPWSDLVSYVMRYARPVNKKIRVLEVGVGAGANIPFFESLNVDYIGIDGSPSTIRRLRSTYPQLAESLLVMDFTKELPTGNFDLIVDRAAITHNSTESIIKTLSLVYQSLNDDGVFIGIDWFSSEYSDFLNEKLGEYSTDKWTKKFHHGSRAFTGLGNVHFSDFQHLQYLFKDFNLSHVQHKTIKEIENDDEWNFASFNFIAQKK